MAKPKKPLTWEMLREQLSYSPETGEFRWRIHRPKCRFQVGDVAGSLTNVGYVQVWLSGRNYAGHRLAWFYVHGEWPSQYIDHINGLKVDNRIANLREASPQMNSQNKRRAEKRAKVQVLGVDQDRPGKYRAKIVVDGKPIFLGRYQTPEQAGEAYLQAKRKLHAGCTL